MSDTLHTPVICASERHGRGPVLVMLHGLFGDRDNLRTAARGLAEDHDVIRLDLPGHGASPRLPSYSYPTLANAVTDTLDALAIDRCRLLGHSLGGKVAMQLATDQLHQRIERLIVVDIAPRHYDPHHAAMLKAMDEMPQEDLSPRSRADKALQAVVPEQATRQFLLKSLKPDENGLPQWRFDVTALRRDYDALRASPDFVRNITVPTLFIKGSDSDYINGADEAIIRTHFDQPELKIMLKAGHMPHAEQPDLFERLCRSFLLPNRQDTQPAG